MVGTAEKRLREHCLCGGSTSGFSINTPEETDDETSSMSREMPSAGGSKEGSRQPLALSSAPPCLLLLAAVSPDTYCEQMSRVPCESDESSSFIWNPSDRSAEELPSSSTSEKAATSDAGVRQDKATNGLQQRSEACSRSEEAAAPSSVPADSTDLQPPCAQGKARSVSRALPEPPHSASAGPCGRSAHAPFLAAEPVRVLQWCNSRDQSAPSAKTLLPASKHGAGNLSSFLITYQ